MCFAPLHVDHTLSLLLDNSASFTPSKKDTVSKMEGKTNFSRRLQAVRKRDCQVYGNLDVECRPKQFDGLT